MFDDLDRLRDNEVLSALLEHYAGFAEREAWQDRLMQLDGADRNHLVRLHGELLAFGWIEQNTGGARSAADGEVRQCYRATAAGSRALRQLRQERKAACT